MPPLSCLTVRSHQPWQHGDEAIEYERLTWFPPECTESVRNWPGSNSNGSAPTPSTGASRNVLTLGVSWKTRATRSLPTKSEERRVGKECDSTCRSGVSTYH